jgi:TonB family protein
MWGSVLILAMAVQAADTAPLPRASVVVPAPVPVPPPLVDDARPPAGASAAMAAAFANLPKVKTRARQLKSAPLVYPEAERKLGTTGAVRILALVNAEGSVSEVSVARSSGVLAFDEAAVKLIAATQFRPAADALGAPLATPFMQMVRFVTDEGQPSNIAQYAAVAYPETERAAGRHGRVTIEGIIGSDGRMSDPKVTVSSRAPALDAAALAGARATLFRAEPPEPGVAPRPTQIRYNFDSLHSPGQGGGVLRYTCAQLVLDEDWWRTTWEPKKRTSFYYMMSGLSFIIRMQSAPMSAPGLSASIREFEGRYDKMIEKCRSKPEALVVDTFKPDGVYMRRLAERSQ